MGRKIPGKKHRTIKDPYKQKQKRLDSIRLKINNPPSNSNEQEIPKSLLKIMELKAKAKQAVTRKPKKRFKRSVSLSVAKVLDKDPFQKGMKKPDRIIPNLTQKPNESAQSFLRRFDTMTQNLINEVEFEKKFGVEIKKNPDTGEVIEVKKTRKKNSKSKKKKLSEKRKEKLTQKKENLKNIKDFSQLKDKVEFGEVVHRPPDLSKLKKPENKEKNKAEEPRYSNLFLQNIIQSTDIKNKNPPKTLEKEKQENERKFIVEAYRKLKRKKARV